VSGVILGLAVAFLAATIGFVGAMFVMVDVKDGKNKELWNGKGTRNWIFRCVCRRGDVW
jgi:hypothetical protein